MNNEKENFSREDILKIRILFLLICIIHIPIMCLQDLLKNKTQKEISDFMEYHKELTNLKKRASWESCSRLQSRLDRIPNIQKETASLRKELETLINANIEKGLIRSDEVHLKIAGDFKGKRLVNEFRNNSYMLQIRRKYGRISWNYLAMRHTSDEDIAFQEIRDYKREIQKMQEDLLKVNSLEERQEIEKLIVFQQIALIEFKLTILIISQFFLAQEIAKEPEVSHEFLKCVQGIEKFWGKKFPINIWFFE